MLAYFSRYSQVESYPPLSFYFKPDLKTPSKFGEHPSAQFHLHRKEACFVHRDKYCDCLQPEGKAALDNHGQIA